MNLCLHRILHVFQQHQELQPLHEPALLSVRGFNCEPGSPSNVRGQDLFRNHYCMFVFFFANNWSRVGCFFFWRPYEWMMESRN